MAPIHDAVEHDKLPEVKRLIEQDPQVVHAAGNSGMLPVHFAAMKGRLEIMMYLLDHGASVSQVTGCGTTALLTACCYGKLDIVELLLVRGADAANMTKNTRRSCLMAAADRGHHHVVRCLLSHQPAIPLNVQNNEGRTALWGACATGEREVVRMLLEAGADPSVADSRGRTPLYIAKSFAQNQCVLLLQVSKAEIGFPTKSCAALCANVETERIIYWVLYLPVNK